MADDRQLHLAVDDLLGHRVRNKFAELLVVGANRRSLRSLLAAQIVVAGVSLVIILDEDRLTQKAARS